MSSRQAMSALSKAKLEALAKGQYPAADCVFLVGPVDETAELVNACSADLELASEVFTAMLKDEWQGQSGANNIRIKNIQPHIFKLLVEFIHVSDCFVDGDNWKDLVDLAVAADQFMIEPLVEYCASILKDLVNVDNVWEILNAAHHIANVVLICTKLLSEETLKCIESPSFLKVSSYGIVHFLQLNECNIPSEFMLVNACLQVANTLPEKEASELMRAAIPHLRLLLLQLDEIKTLSIYLKDAEKIALANYFIFNHEPSTLGDLNCSQIERTKSADFMFDKELTMKFIPEAILPSNTFDVLTKEVIESKNFEYFGIEFETLQNICLKGAEILTRVNQYPKYKYDAPSKRYLAEPGKYEESLTLVVFYRVKSNDDYTYVHTSYCKGMELMNSSIAVSFADGIFIPKGVHVLIDVRTSKKPVQYLKIIDRCTFTDNLKSIERNNLAVSDLKCNKWCHPDQSESKEGWKFNEEDDWMWIVKNIKYSLVKINIQ